MFYNNLSEVSSLKQIRYKYLYKRYSRYCIIVYFIGKNMYNSLSYYCILNRKIMLTFDECYAIIRLVVFIFFRWEWRIITALEDKILKEGKVLPGNILKVDCFLNHQIDVSFLMKMGKEISNLYKDEPVNKILTIETSGIPIAFAAAYFMTVPVVFAKKDKSGNISDDVYSSKVTSFTRKNTYDAVVSKDFLGNTDKLLIIDDFLAKGNALKGLIDIVNQSGALLCGCVIGIEKGFQGGGDELRKQGTRIDSLALIDSMDENSLTFRK